MGFAAAAGLAARAAFAACGSTAAVLAVGLATVPEARFGLGELLLSVTVRSLAWTDPRRSQAGFRPAACHAPGPRRVSS
jgi:type IV secretory pathway TrbD component